MNLCFGLIDKDIRAIRDIFTHYPQVEKCVIYGSRAKGNYKIGSDIDLTLYGGNNLDLGVLLRIMEELDDLMLPYTFDVSIFRCIENSDMIAHIRRVGLLFYEKK